MNFVFGVFLLGRLCLAIVRFVTFPCLDSLLFPLLLLLLLLLIVVTAVSDDSALSCSLAAPDDCSVFSLVLCYLRALFEIELDFSSGDEHWFSG